MRPPIQGIGARELNPDELAIGWIWVGISAQQRVEFVDPDADDPETVRTEFEEVIEVAAATAAEEER